MKLRRIAFPLALASTFLFFPTAAFAQPAPVSKSQKVAPPEALEKLAALKKELGLSDKNDAIDPDKACEVIFVQQGSSIWNDENRMQGWTDVPLSDSGRKTVHKLKTELADVTISAIYCSDLQRSKETASIVGEGHACPIVANPALKGEAHGNLEGLLQQDYYQDAHFKQYKSLSPVEKIFFSVGKGGESKADVARRMIPFLKQICEENRNKTIVVVTHGGNIKFLNFLMGDYTDETFAVLPHGESMRILSDGRSFVKK